MHDSLDIEIIDFIDLINHTLSSDFIELWRYKCSEKFIKHFQVKLLHARSNQKPLKITSLYSYSTKKCKYSREQVENFFISINIDLYRPLISGNLKL